MADASENAKLSWFPKLERLDPTTISRDRPVDQTISAAKVLQLASLGKIPAWQLEMLEGAVPDLAARGPLGELKRAINHIGASLFDIHQHAYACKRSGARATLAFLRVTASQHLERLRGYVNTFAVILQRSACVDSLVPPGGRTKEEYVMRLLGMAEEAVAIGRRYVLWESGDVANCTGYMPAAVYLTEDECKIENILVADCRVRRALWDELQYLKRLEATVLARAQARNEQSKGERGLLRTPIVFISSTSEDLKEYRTQAEKAALKAGYLPRMMEYFAASGAHPPLEACLAKIAGSETEPPVDVLVVIVAHRYGWVPPDQPGAERKSITWLECEKAKENGKEVLAFLVDEKHDWNPDRREETRVSQAIREGKATAELLAEVQENTARLVRFKAWLDSQGIRATFTTPESLHAGVIAALYDWRNRHTEFGRSDAAESPAVPPVVKAAALSNRDGASAQKRANLLAKWSLRNSRRRRDFEDAVLAAEPRVRDAEADRQAMSLYNSGNSKARSGDVDGSISDYTAAAEIPGASTEMKAKALFNRAIVRGKQGDSNGEIVDYTAIVSMPGISAESKARSLINRGVRRSGTNDAVGAIADFSSVLEMADAPVDQKQKAFCNRGAQKGKQGDMDGAIADITAFAEFPGIPTERRAQALFTCGLLKSQEGALNGAIAYFSRILDLPDLPISETARALLARAIANGQKNDAKAEIADCTSIIELEGVPAEAKVDALAHRACARQRIGDDSGAIADYIALAEMPQAPDTFRAWAILNRRSEISDKDEIEKAIADFSAVTEMPGASAEQKALAFCCRADAKSLRGDIEGAIVDYTSALEMAELPIEARVHALLVRASSRAEQGNPDGAIEDDTTAAQLPGISVEDKAIALLDRGYRKVSKGDATGAILDFSAVADMPNIAADQKASALYNRGGTKAGLGDIAGARADFAAIVDMPGVAAAQRAEALVNLAATKGELGDVDGELADYASVLALPDAPTDAKARALFNRAILKASRGDADGSVADFSAIADEPNAPSDLKAEALAALKDAG